MKRLSLLITAFITSAAAQAPGGPPPGFFPSDMKNVGDLWIELCGPLGFACYDVEAKVWGQVCNSWIAADMMADPRDAGYISVPILMHYAGWRCGKNGSLISPDRHGIFNDGHFIEEGSLAEKELFEHLFTPPGKTEETR